jgi:hypothetical protein
MTVVAAGFLYLNAVGSLSDDDSWVGRRGILTYGWPFAVLERRVSAVQGKTIPIGPLHWTIYAGVPLRILIDIGMAATGLWATFRLCEPQRRRSRSQVAAPATKAVARRLSISRSTAVIVMVEAVLLLLLNLTSSSRWTPAWFTFQNADWSGLYGWPIGFNSLDAPEHISFVIDILIGIVLLLLTWRICESVIRRREGRGT